VWAKRDQMETEAGLKGYLYKSVYHACLRWLEREKSAARNLAAYKSLNETEDQDCSVGIINAETIRLLHEAIETLPEQCRKIFKRLYVEGKTVKETAAELKLTISTINNQKARGISLLRERLGNGLMLLFFFLQG
ncbi:MAG TPA: sigma-70 family RNA polymerase sigma factor, partial [Chitinophagaceae bacterium]